MRRYQAEMAQFRDEQLAEISKLTLDGFDEGEDTEDEDLGDWTDIARRAREHAGLPPDPDERLGPAHGARGKWSLLYPVARSTASTRPRRRGSHPPLRPPRDGGGTRPSAPSRGGSLSLLRALGRLLHACCHGGGELRRGARTRRRPNRLNWLVSYRPLATTRRLRETASYAIAEAELISELFRRHSIYALLSGGGRPGETNAQITQTLSACPTLCASAAARDAAARDAAKVQDNVRRTTNHRTPAPVLDLRAPPPPHGTSSATWTPGV